MKNRLPLTCIFHRAVSGGKSHGSDFGSGDCRLFLCSSDVFTGECFRTFCRQSRPLRFSVNSPVAHIRNIHGIGRDLGGRLSTRINKPVFLEAVFLSRERNVSALIKPSFVFKALFWQVSDSEQGRRSDKYYEQWETFIGNEVVPSVHEHGEQELYWRREEPGFLEAQHIASICSVLQQVKHVQWTSATEESLVQLDIRLNTYLVYEVLKRQQSSDIAFSFFHWAKSQPGYKHEISVYTRMATILGSAQHYEALRDLMLDMQSEKCEPNLAFYNALVHIFTQGHMMDEALGILETIKASQWLPTYFTYKCLIHSSLKSGNLRTGAEMYTKMIQAGFVPDNTTVNLLIDTLSKAGQVRTACNIFRDMVKSGYVPDVYTYTIVIRSLGKRGELTAAWNIFKEMTNAGCLPSSYTYHSLIHAFGREGKVEQACKLVKEMVSKGHQPSILTYNILVDAYCKAGDWDKAIKLFEQMKGIADTVTYNSIMDQAFKKGDTHVASLLFQQMGARGCIANRITYAILIRGLAKAGKVEEVCSLYEEMRRLNLKLDTTIFNNLIDCLGKTDMDSACKMFDEMKNEGVHPSVCTYNILINRLCKSGRIDAACLAAEEMAQAGCVPGRVTYNSLISSLGKAKKVDSACKLFTEMQKVGIKPDVVTYTSLIDGFFTVGNIDSALYMFQEMKKVGCHPNVVTYNLLLDHLIRNGRLVAALNFSREMKEKGVNSDEITETILCRLPKSTRNGDVSDGQ